MMNAGWIFSTAAAPIWRKPRQFAAYFLVLWLLALAIFLFQSFVLMLDLAQSRSSAEVLGGEIELDSGYRLISTDERAFLTAKGIEFSEDLRFRSMVQAESQGHALARLSMVRAVDSHYPLFGEAQTEPARDHISALLAPENGHLGAILSPELADYLDVKIGQDITIADEVFIFRGVMLRRPESASGSEAFLPTAWIAYEAARALTSTNNDLLMQNTVRLDLPPSLDPQAFREQSQAQFGNANWQMTTAENFAKRQAGMLDTARRLGGLVNLLVSLALGSALFCLCRTHISEEEASLQLLSTLGAKSSQIALLLMARFALLFVFALIASSITAFLIEPLISTYVAQPALGITISGASITHALLTSSIWLLLIGITAVAVAYASLGRRRLLAWGLAGCAALAFSLLAARRYEFDHLMVVVIGAFFMAISGFFVIIRLAKRFFSLAPNSGLGGFALRQYGAKTSSQEYFAAALFANLIIATAFAASFVAIDESLNKLHQVPKPSHYVADLQVDQLANFEALTVQNKLRVQSLKAVVRARILAPDDNAANLSWVYRGDRFFGIDANNDYGLKQTAAQTYEIALDEEIATSLNLAIGDHLQAAVLGENYEFIVKALRKYQLNWTNLDFFILLPPEALTTMPHIYVASLNLTESQRPVLRQIIDQFPNAILISSTNTLNRIDKMAGDLERALRLLALHVGGAAFIALLAIATILSRKERFDLAIFEIMGMTSSERNGMIWRKILLNAMMASLGSAALALVFVRLALPRLTALDVTISLEKIMLVSTGIGFVFAFIPAILLIFNNNFAKNIENYAQDYQRLKLDF